MHFINIFRLPSPSDISPTFKKVPYVFVADDAFALTENMMKPYARSSLTESERIFNYRLSRARRMIENSFGILSAQWRIFRTTINAHPEMVELIIETCVCLHNYLRLGEDSVFGLVDEELATHIKPGAWRSMESNLLSLERNTTNSNNKAKALRDRFAQYFVNEGSVDWQLDRI